MGATGSGQVIAVVDTGLYTSEPGLAGRISPDSTGINGNTGVEAYPGDEADDFDGDHGTIVSLVAAAAKDGVGNVGIAYDATILGIRSDDPGSCAEATKGSCTFGDISDGITYAVDHGAVVVNLSLGGAAPTSAERAAVQYAADNNVVVVISSGNDSTARPDAFARGLAAVGSGNVIIVGSVDFTGEESDFSNGARGSTDTYISALGDLVYVDIHGGYLYSGTSFSAPQVSGAVALIAQAFPAMTAAEIVDLLLSTAQDVGEVGPDDVYGQGILDIYEAFQPQGVTTLGASRTAVLPLDATTGAGSSAMGDSLQAASIDAIVLDKYSRAFHHDIGRSMRSATVAPRLRSAIGSETESLSLAEGRAAVAFTIDASAPQSGFEGVDQLRLTQEDAARSRTLAARIALQVSPDTQLGFAFADSANGLVAQMQGRDRPAFLIAREAGGDEATFQRADASLAIRRKIGDWGLTLSGESGQFVTAAPVNFNLHGEFEREQEKVRTVSVAFDRDWGALETALGISWMDEDRTVLGARFHEALGGGGANSLFINASAGWDIASNLRLGGTLRGGLTMADAGSVIASGSNLYSLSWAVDLQRRGFIGEHDSLGFRLSQPLRVENGGLNLNLPVDYSYDTQSATYGIVPLSLTPTGREIVGELAWRGPVGFGWASASLFYRRDPGHYSTLPDDKGVALRWNAKF